MAAVIPAMRCASPKVLAGGARAAPSLRTSDRAPGPSVSGKGRVARVTVRATSRRSRWTNAACFNSSSNRLSNPCGILETIGSTRFGAAARRSSSVSAGRRIKAASDIGLPVGTCPRDCRARSSGPLGFTIWRSNAAIPSSSFARSSATAAARALWIEAPPPCQCPESIVRGVCPQ